MRRELISALLVAAAGATFWAYNIASSLIREFSANTTFLDLAVLFLLGLITGGSLGLALWLSRK